MLGRKRREQMELFVAGSLEKLIPKDHILHRVNRVLDLSWLREEVAECYCAENGRPGIDPEVAVRLMLAGLLLGYVHDRRLLREAQVNLAIRWFIGYGLHEDLPDHSSLTRIRQRWGEARFREIFRRTVKACLDAKVAKGEVVHVDASLIRADVSWESLAERHVDDVVRENASEDEAGKKKRGGRRGGGPGQVSRTDPDARLARKSGRVGFEPSYKQHAVVDDERGVVLDVSVREGTVNEREMMESQVDAVHELTGREPALVTADSGYAYSKVYAALERRGVDALIPAKKEPTQSRVPMQLFRYDARRKVVKCPGGKTLTPRQATERGALLCIEDARLRGVRAEARLFVEVAHEQDGVGAARVSGAVARASAACALGGGGASAVAAPHVALGGLPRRGENLARTGKSGASRSGQHEDPVLPDGDCGQPQAARRRCCSAFIRPLEGLCRPQKPNARTSRSLAPLGLALRRRVSRHTTRFRKGVIQQTLKGGVGGVGFQAEGGRAGRVKYHSLRLPPILPCHEPPNPPCQGGFFNNPSPGGIDCRGRIHAARRWKAKRQGRVYATPTNGNDTPLTPPQVKAAKDISRSCEPLHRAASRRG